MKLNKNQIQFIDGFLQRNDVIYVDIRAEMIDHIATGVEEKMKVEDIEFHDAFVSYVNSNRKEIFSMNKKTWQSTLSELKNYFRFFLKPKSLFAVVLIIMLFFTFRKTMVYTFLKEDLSFYFLLIFLSYSMLSMIYFFGIKKKRYYFIERSNIVLSILYWINLFLFKPFDKQEYISDVLTIVFMCLFVVYVLYAINQINKFFNSKMIIK
ncbi:MAG: hypothetical protein O9282_02030 [Flavobacterium sp.]|uniref:Uncharacterized protein n=1 Tax=Flavobacterium macrobrachii TaxID=591204 RepID=A0ABS2D0W7_9FLAO|nr:MULTISPECIES: hypothetical protein [Flavobacterium]MBM6500858.1 hypothetical protein [Flavobacterium macrobrachii]MCZ8330072.1 hypothetical protein [Flavobacterium sp.]